MVTNMATMQNFFFNWCSGEVGVQLGDDYDDGEICGMIGRGKSKYAEKTCPSAALSTTNPTYCPDANPARRGGKPTSNSLSYGTAYTNIRGYT
jgi:hypothetical protein